MCDMLHNHENNIYGEIFPLNLASIASKQTFFNILINILSPVFYDPTLLYLAFNICVSESKSLSVVVQKFLISFCRLLFFVFKGIHWNF